MTELLRIDELTKHFPVYRGIFRRKVGAVQAVTDVSLALEKGETLAVVGESGCGKSTLGRSILRLHEPSKGRISFNDSDVTALDRREMRALRRDMQIIFQDPFGSLNPRMTVRETLSEPFWLHGLATRENIHAKVDELITMCGLSAWHADRYPHEFSGGQRQRVGVARALATRPSLIICDEPVSALDVSIQAQIVNLLQDLQKKLGIAYIFITHDLGVVRHIANRVAVMYLGRVIELADTANLYQYPRHPYTQILLSSAPRPDPTIARKTISITGSIPSALEMPPGCAFHPRCPFATDRCRIERPQLRLVGESVVACHHAKQIGSASAQDRVSTDNSVFLRRLQTLKAARS